MRKTLIWAIATLAFTGGFRIHELLSRERQSYIPFVTLLGKYLVLKENDKYPHIQILLKTQGGEKRTKSFDAHNPIFHTEDGKMFNADLKD